MDFRLLGPIEVVGDGGLPLSIGTGRQRALLALLILRANELVGSDRLVDELWGESPPATAHKMLHNQVSALRQALGRNGRLETHGSGYRLKVDPGERDVDRFEGLLARGRAQMEADPEGAAETFRRALDLWRGPPLSDLAYEPFAQTEIARLEERRWVAFEARVEAELALGRHADLVSELEAVVAEQPLREHLHGQLMLALYRCGRQAEALEAFRRARRTLVEAVGLEPGSELRELQAAILAQDPALDLTPRAEDLPPALEGGSPLLAGRGRELAELRERLAEASAGRGGLVLVCGPRGMGKTRLAAELARDALRERMVVLYAGAGSSPDEALAAVRRAQGRGRSALLILDDADDASPAVLVSAATLARDIAPRPLLILALHRGPEPPAFAALAGSRIELQPLGVEAVAEIARLYLPAGAESPPVRTLAAESDGVPLAVHQAAAEWARVEAAELLEDSAGRAAADRGDLRAAEARLAGNVLDLQAAGWRGRLYATAADDATPAPAVCPFVGLAPFDADHAEYFFGRERLVAEMVARLVGAPLLSVVGPSGSGKSSAVRAGLLPALASGVLPGSERWRQVLMRPGEHPLAELKRLFPGASLPQEERVALAVDQFEEVFTACRDEDERAAFLDALVDAARDRDQRILVVLAMRADFYGRCASHDELARLVGANQVLVGPMRRDELRRAIELPARRAGLRVEPSLTDALIRDVLGEPGGLPLLSASLVELWRQRDGRVMRHVAHERTGGVRAAVGRLAEHTYTQLSEPERRAARRILMRLAAAGDEEAAFVRRRVPFDELDLERDDHAAAALAALTNSRLVTTGEGAVEVAHEALLREWPRLRGWLEEDAESRRLHQHLIHAARDWQSAGRDAGELYRGARLASALHWWSGQEQEMNELEREFLAESRDASELEADRQRRAIRRLRVLLAGLAALLALAAVAGVVALNQRGEARDAALAADAQRLGAEALNDERLDRALLLARAGVDLHDSVATRSNLLAVLLRNPAAALGVLRGKSDDQLVALAVSPDERRLAIGDLAGTVTIFDAGSRRELGEYQLRDGLVQTLEFSPDGRTLAVTGQEPVNEPPGALVDLIDPRTAKRRVRIELPRFPDPSQWIVANVAFLPNGRDLVVAQIHNDYPDGPATVLHRVNGATGAIEGRALRVGSHAALGLFPTADRRRLFVTSARDDETYEIDTQALRVVRRYSAGAFAGALKPDGSAFALGSEGGRVRLLDLGSGRVRRFSGRHQAGILRMAFTPDGRTLVSSDASGEVIVWDVADGETSETLSAHRGEVWGLKVSSDGDTLYSAAADGSAVVWDLSGDRRLARSFDAGAPFAVESDDFPRGLALDPQGRSLAVTQSDGTIEVLEAQTLRSRGRLRSSEGAALAVDYSPTGRLLAVTGESGLVTLWDARTLRPAGELRGLRGPSQAVTFSPDGKQLAAAEVNVERPRLRVWDLRTGAPTLRRWRWDYSRVTGSPSLAFSPDRELLAAAALDRGTEIIDARSGRLMKRLPNADFSRSVAFSPDGSLLAVGQTDGQVRLWSTDAWDPVGRTLEGHTARVTSIEFFPGGRTLATASADGTTQLWDVGTQKPIGSALTVERGDPQSGNTWLAAALTPDGSRLFAVSNRGRGVRFEVSAEAWKRHACVVAGRDLTAREWGDALPDRPYQAVCSDG